MWDSPARVLLLLLFLSSCPSCLPPTPPWAGAASHSTSVGGSQRVSFLFSLFIFRERGREERERGKHQCVAASAPPTGNLACSPGTCPHWQSNWQPSGWQAGAQSTEPLQPGRVSFLWDGPLIAILPHAGAQQGECVHTPACRAPTKHGCSPGWLFDGLAPALRLPVPSQSRRGLSSVS